MSLLGQILGTVSGGKDVKVSEQLLFDKIIGFRGIVDGVGASTLVFNTACALSDVTNMNICVVDTHILNPVLAAYFSGAAENGTKDWFDFNSDGSNISDIAYSTRFSNVYLVSLYRRGLPELLSNYDNEKIVTGLFDTLAKFFDIILVDIAHEPTFIASMSAIRCNKIYSVFESSLGCMTNLKASINTMVELGIPPYKLSKVVLNKHIEDVNSGYQNVLNKYNFKLLATIPFSVDIARNNVIGNKIWGLASNKAAITRFNQAMDSILDDILQSNNNVQGYLKDESEVTEIENKNEAPKRVDGEPFDYIEPVGKPMKRTKIRPKGVQPRGLAKGIGAENMVNSAQGASVQQNTTQGVASPMPKPDVVNNAGMSQINNAQGQAQNDFAPAQNDFAPMQGGFAPVQGDFAPAQNDFAPMQGGFVPVQGNEQAFSPADPMGKSLNNGFAQKAGNSVANPFMSGGNKNA